MAAEIKKRIVIAGFGDTGLLVAAHLPDEYEVIGISTKPLLVSGQELGARLTKLEAWKSNYLMDFAKFEKLVGTEIIHGSVLSINPENHSISVSKASGETSTISYDALVLASGTSNGFWRTPDVKSEDEIEADLSAQSQMLASAKTIAIIGAGPTGVSTASNLKETQADKDVHLFFGREEVLSGYHPKTRVFAMKRLQEQGVILHPGHRAMTPKDTSLPILQPGLISFSTGQSDFKADCILWATGNLRPNNGFIPVQMLNEDGFVRVEDTLQVIGHPNIFAIGDIAATDPNRSSARNAGFQLAAKNIDRFLSGRPKKMKAFCAPLHRWGSIFGIQKEGMRIFTPKGSSVRVSPKWVRKILFPVFVDRMIYRGINRRAERKNK